MSEKDEDQRIQSELEQFEDRVLKLRQEQLKQDQERDKRAKEDQLREQQKIQDILQDRAMELLVEKQFQYINCLREDSHKEEQLNMVCFDEECDSDLQFLEPICSLCLDSGEVHRKQPHKTKNLKKVIVELSRQIDVINSKQFKNQKFKEIIELAKDFKKLADQVNHVALNIIQVLKDSKKENKQANEVSQIVEQSIKELLETQDYKRSKEIMKLINKCTIMNQGELRLVKSKKSDTNTDLLNYQDKMKNFYNYLELEIKTMEIESCSMQQTGKQCLEMYQGLYEQNHAVTEIVPGTVFQGHAEKFCRLFSKESYSKNEESRIFFKFTFEEIDFPKFFSLGIVKDNQKAMPQNDTNRIFQSFFDEYNANMTTFPPKRSFRNIAKPGTIFYASIDFDNETFEITECTNSVKAYYKRPKKILPKDKDIKIDGEKWRIYMYFKGNHRIRILD